VRPVQARVANLGQRLANVEKGLHAARDNRLAALQRRLLG
jgi:hypothetical protein